LKMIKRLILSLFLTSGLVLSSQGQTDKQNLISINDSVKIKNTIEGFYSWYGEIIKRNRLSKEFSPAFIKDKDGMTSLDFTQYKERLTRHNFTDDFIKRRMHDYNACLENLKTIPYETFLTYQDQDQLKKMDCDLASVYPWAKSIDSPDGAELLELYKLNKNTVEGKVRFFTKTPDGVKQYWGSATLTLIKFKVGWEINDIK